MNLKRQVSLIALLFLHNMTLRADEVAENSALEYLKSQQVSVDISWRNYQLIDSISEAQKKWLSRRILNFRKIHIREQAQFEVLQSKCDGNLAMVLIAVSDLVDPFYYNIVPLALCQDSNVWRPSPVIGSYRYTGIKDYLTLGETRRGSLEKWAKEQIRELLPKAAESRRSAARLKLEKYRSQNLKTEDVSREDVVLFFMQMCQEENLLGLLACLREDDVSGRLAITEAFQRSQNLGVWKDLLDKNYIYRPLKKLEGLSSVVSVGVSTSDFIDSSKIIELEIKKDSATGCWSINLPQVLHLKQNQSDGFPRFSKYQLKPKNRDRLGEVEKELYSKFSAEGVNSFSELKGVLIAAIQDVDVSRYYGLVDSTAEGNAPYEWLDAKKFWAQMTLNDRLEERVVFGKEYGDIAIISLFTYLKSRPAKYKVVDVCAIKKDGKWYLEPRYDVTKAKAKDLLPATALVEYEEADLKSAAFAFGQILPSASPLEAPLPIAIEEKDAVLDCFTKYSSALADKNLEQASSFIASAEGAEQDLLYFMGHEYNQLQARKSSFRHVEVLCTDKMAGVIVAEDFKNDADPEYRLYVLVKQEGGLRVIPQAVYMYEYARGQKLLNETVRKQLDSCFDALFIEQREALIQQFNQKVEELLKQEND